MNFRVTVLLAAFAIAGCGASEQTEAGRSDRSESQVKAAAPPIDAAPATLAALNCIPWDGTIPDNPEPAAEPYPSDSFANETDTSPNAGDGGGAETRIRAVRDIRAYGGLLRWTVSESGEEEYYNWFIEGDPDAIKQAVIAAEGGSLRKIKDSVWSADYQLYVHAGSYNLGTPIALHGWLNRPGNDLIVLTTTANPNGVRFSCGGVFGDFPADFE